MENTINSPEKIKKSELQTMYAEFQSLKSPLDSSDFDTRMNARVAFMGLITRLKALQPDLFDFITVPNFNVFLEPITYAIELPYPSVYLTDFEEFFSLVLEDSESPPTPNVQEVSSPETFVTSEPETLQSQLDPTVTKSIVIQTQKRVKIETNNELPVLIEQVNTLMSQLPQPYFIVYNKNKDIRSFNESKLRKAILDLEFLVEFSKKFPDFQYTAKDLPDEYHTHYLGHIFEIQMRIVRPRLVDLQKKFAKEMQEILDYLHYCKESKEVLRSKLIESSFELINLLAKIIHEINDFVRFIRIAGLNVDIPDEAKLFSNPNYLFDIFKNKYLAEINLAAKHFVNENRKSKVKSAYLRFCVGLNNDPRTKTVYKQILEPENFEAYQEAIVQLHQIFKDINPEMQKLLHGNT